MLRRCCVSLLLLLAFPISASAQGGECAVFLDSIMPGEYMRCMAAIQRSEQTRREVWMLQGLSAHPYGQQQEQQRLYQLDPEYRQLHNRNMILNHGMGGCTPNFSTGGCL